MVKVLKTNAGFFLAFKDTAPFIIGTKAMQQTIGNSQADKFQQ